MMMLFLHKINSDCRENYIDLLQIVPYMGKEEGEFHAMLMEASSWSS